MTARTSLPSFPSLSSGQPGVAQAPGPSLPAQPTYAPQFCVPTLPSPACPCLSVGSSLSYFVVTEASSTQKVLNYIRQTLVSASRLKWEGKAGEYYRNSLRTLMKEESEAELALTRMRRLCQ